ncbi:MAG: universal stress protein [Saprospiraceae bacterium]|nr:universal stress protein [Saprospiraceae bacterium]
MIDIKIYGTGTSGHQLAKMKLTKCLSDAALDFHITDISNIKEIMDDQIEYVPCIKVNDDNLFEIKQNGRYSASLRDVIQKILKIDNYGKMTKILVPTDFSDASNNAYNFANHLSKDLTGVLLLTHIYYPTSTDVNQFVVINEEAEKIHREKLDSLVNTLNQDWIGSFVKEPFIEGVFKVGFPRVELTEMSKQSDTIMVMGTTGSGDNFKKVFGSLSLDMIDHCYCPLFLVPPGAAYSKIDEIVYLSEDLKNDANHLLYTGKICAKIGSDLRIVHYRTKSKDEYDVSDTIKIMDEYFPEVKYHLEIIDTEDLFKGVKSLINEDTNHLVVISTKHRNIFQNIFHKSISEFAAIHSTSPLLILTDKTSEVSV